MQTGISTSSLFSRYYTEDALLELNKNGVKVAEVFLESYSEYNKSFGEILKKNKGEIEVHSIHTLTTQFEPQLYSVNKRANEDSFKLLETTMQAGECVNAKYYTFHGGARFKKTPLVLNMERVAENTQRIIDACKKHGVTLAYENVHWGYYNYIGFFTELKTRTVGLKGTFDVKQARQSNVDYKEFIAEMGSDIVTAHISDVSADGKMCLPGSKNAITDFYEVFSRLRDVGFDGAILIEAYPSDFKEMRELYDSLDYIENLAQKVFKK